MSYLGSSVTQHFIKEAGIDVRVGELAGLIQETMESYEVEVNGKVYPGERYRWFKRLLTRLFTIRA